MTWWTAERIEKLKELWAEGQSCSEIAASMGAASRNAVIGKIHRLGLQDRKPSTKKHAAKQPGENPDFQKSRPRLAPRPAARRANLAPGEVAPPPVPDAPPEHLFKNILNPGAVHFLDRRPSQCNFPLWSDDAPFERKFVCAAPRANDIGPYCSEHNRCAHADDNAAWAKSMKSQTSLKSVRRVA